MKKIIVAGGGFGGITAVKTLIRLGTKAEIFLIDKNTYHLFTPSLYEVATNESPRKNIAVPFAAIFGDKVRPVVGEISGVDVAGRIVQLADGTTWPFDYLILALGSETSYFGIPGLQENSLPLKSIDDALRIRNALDEIYKSGRDKIHIIVAGGGFSGVELSAELTAMREHLSTKYHLDSQNIEIAIVEGLDHMLNGLDPKVISDARRRIESLGINLHLGSNIKTVDAQFVETADGQKYPFDILIWTGGVSANHLLSKIGLPTNKKGQVEVNEFLQVSGANDIFAVGDGAGFVEQGSGKFAPWVAEIAQKQGKSAAKNVYYSTVGRSLKPYRLKHAGYVVPLKGRYALAPLNWIYLHGFLGWILQQLVFLNYLLSILSPVKAVKKWNAFESELDQD